MYTDYHTYGFGKAPLEYRIKRYLEHHTPPGFIPIHQGEFNHMVDKQYTKLTKLEKQFGLSIRPLGWEAPSAT